MYHFEIAVRTGLHYALVAHGIIGNLWQQSSLVTINNLREEVPDAFATFQKEA